jgi:hypothetical protein
VLKRNEIKHRERSKTNPKEAAQKDLSTEELLKESTVPLWNVPYESQVSVIAVFTFVCTNSSSNILFTCFQLQIKMDKMRSILKNLAKELVYVNKFSPRIRKFLEDRFAQYEGLPCELAEIRHAPAESYVNGYRNKCEFTVGRCAQFRVFVTK